MIPLRRLFVWILALILCATASADTLKIPSGLTEIEEEAFAGTAATDLELPETKLTIGSRAFSGSALRSVHFPVNSRITLASDAFEGCDVYGYASDTSVNRNALANMVVSVPGRTYALLIGNSDYAYQSDLISSLHDARNMQRMLNSYSNVSCSILTNQTAAGILNGISSVLGRATADDLCIFFFSGHGLNGTTDYDSRYGSLCGINYGNGAATPDTVTPTQLRTALDRLSARRIVVLIDCCGSGGVLTDDGSDIIMTRSVSSSSALSEITAAKLFNASMISAFSSGIQSKTANISTYASGSTLIDSRYAVITACAWNEKAYSVESAAKGYYGFLTNQICGPLGWNCSTESAGTLQADTRADGMITLKELSSCIPSTLTYTTSSGAVYSSSVQRSIPYPELVFLSR